MYDDIHIRRVRKDLKAGWENVVILEKRYSISGVLVSHCMCAFTFSCTSYAFLWAWLQGCVLFVQGPQGEPGPQGFVGPLGKKVSRLNVLREVNSLSHLFCRVRMVREELKATLAKMALKCVHKLQNTPFTFWFMLLVEFDSCEFAFQGPRGEKGRSGPKGIRGQRVSSFYEWCTNTLDFPVCVNRDHVDHKGLLLLRGERDKRWERMRGHWLGGEEFWNPPCIVLLLIAIANMQCWYLKYSTTMVQCDSLCTDL